MRCDAATCCGPPGTGARCWKRTPSPYARRTPHAAHRAQRPQLQLRLRLRLRCDCGCVTAAAWLWLWLWLWL
ncbi:hypothetical protein XarjCFBP7652_11210 [Xanthomonas arboricola]|nr:hypothetical protein XarjCFBP7652_11210 [Xanthomonas arboricola]